MPPQQLQYLESQQCFAAVPTDSLDALVAAFVQHAHACCPVVDVAALAEQHRTRKVPWLLLHAVCIAGASFCKPETIRQAGFTDAGALRSSLFSRAKALVDAGYERDREVVLASAIVLATWCDGAGEPWAAVSWLNTAATVFEGLTLPAERARCVWWTMVARDAFSASLLGRQLRLKTKPRYEMITAADVVAAGVAAADADRFVDTVQMAVWLRQLVLAGEMGGAASVAAPLDEMRAWLADRTHPALVLLGHYHVLYAYLAAADRAPLEADAERAAAAVIDLGADLVLVDDLADLGFDSCAAFALAAVYYLDRVHRAPTDRLFAAQLRVAELVIHHLRDRWHHAVWVSSLCARFHDAKAPMPVGLPSYITDLDLVTA
ncbi:uncharacterized protein V1510DRAFT_413508 [Dipodascopsis tothii]|uniref:uncharacterized protein n=1 Tax=Dipodascopsis tothii TaxID=44089 RepID=UPI0034CED221